VTYHRHIADDTQTQKRQLATTSTNSHFTHQVYRRLQLTSTTNSYQCRDGTVQIYMGFTRHQGRVKLHHF